MEDITRHPSAQIHPSVEIGRGVKIGANVIIGPFKDEPCVIRIGDGCIIHDNVRIQVRYLDMGENCKIHHHTTLTAGSIIMGDNVWVGQYSHLDGTAGLSIGNHVTIGYNCYIWTHSDRSSLPEGSKLVTHKFTRIGDKCWLMGCNVVVNPGVEMGAESVALANSVVTHDTEENQVYGGIPAKKLGFTAWEYSTQT